MNEKQQNELIQHVIASADFRKELQTAIESGKDTDYYWNSEDKVMVETFDEGYALAQVIEVLEKYLLQHQTKRRFNAL